jgi:competence/damage-inducible protein CinA C-terminal domain
MTPTEELATLLLRRGFTLSVAESCTGGMIGSMMTSIPGSSSFFLGGAITYSNESKIKLLNVPSATIETHGAVSRETATEMAKGVLSLYNSDLSVAVTGIAGPGGGTPEKPVGLVFTSVSDKNITDVRRHLFNGDREVVRASASEAAIIHLIDLLKNRI